MAQAPARPTQGPPTDTVEVLDEFDLDDGISVDIGLNEGEGPTVLSNEEYAQRPSAYDEYQKSQATPPGDDRSLLRRFGAGVVNSLNPLPLLDEIFAPDGEGLKRIGKSILTAHKNEFAQAKELYDLSQLPDQSFLNKQLLKMQAFGHIAAALTPLIGPGAAHAGESIGAAREDPGRAAEGLGEAVGMLLPMAKKPGAAVAGAVERAVTPAGAPLASQTMAKAQAYGGRIPGLVQPAAARSAAQGATGTFAAERGIPMTQGERSQNQVRLGLERAAEKTTATGTIMGPRLRQAQVDAMGRVGRELADETGQPPTSPEMAGIGAQQASEALNREVGRGYTTAARQIASRISPVATDALGAGERAFRGLKDRVRAFKMVADEAYGAMRAILEDPKNAREVVVGTETAHMGDGSTFQMQVPITKTVQAPIDLAPAIDALRKVHQEWTTQWSLPRQQISEAYRALDQLVRSQETIVPIADAEKMLSAVKAVSRREGGVAKLATSKLQQVIDRGILEYGDEAANALAAGREAAKAQHQAWEVLAALKGSSKKKALDDAVGEPVKSVRKLTAPDDKAVQLLRSVAAETPEAVPIIARTLLEEIFEKGLAEGTFDFAKARTMANDWNKLGEATKSILFKDPQVRRQIDNFFREAVKKQDRPVAPEIRGTEGVGAFKALLRPRDASIGALRALEKATRGTKTGTSPVIQRLARANLDQMIGRATENSGKISHARALSAEWRNLGHETKRLLYGDNVKNLDAYFQLLDDINFEPNPSGTAYSLLVNGKIGAALALPGSLFFDSPGGFTGALSATSVTMGHELLARLLLKPTTARPLVVAMKTPKANGKMASHSAAALIAAAKKEGFDILQSLPAASKEGLRKSMMLDEAARIGASDEQAQDDGDVEVLDEIGVLDEIDVPAQ